MYSRLWRIINWNLCCSYQVQKPLCMALYPKLHSGNSRSDYSLITCEVSNHWNCYEAECEADQVRSVSLPGWSPTTVSLSELTDVLQLFAHSCAWITNLASDNCSSDFIRSVCVPTCRWNERESSKLIVSTIVHCNGVCSRLIPELLYQAVEEGYSLLAY